MIGIHPQESWLWDVSYQSPLVSLLDSSLLSLETINTNNEAANNVTWQRLIHLERCINMQIASEICDSRGNIHTV